MVLYIYIYTGCDKSNVPFFFLKNFSKKKKCMICAKNSYLKKKGTLLSSHPIYIYIYIHYCSRKTPHFFFFFFKILVIGSTVFK